MKVLHHPASGAVDLSASAAEYDVLASVIAAGAGTCPAETAGAGAGEVALAGIEVSTAPGRAVSVEVDAGLLRITGDPARLAVLAEVVVDIAAAEDGCHLHIEYHPEHWYLAEGSVPLIINSPHGGMPRR